MIPNVYNPQDLNRYSFENNNPYKNVDPNGHDGGSSALLVGIAIVIIIIIVVPVIWELAGKGNPVDDMTHTSQQRTYQEKKSESNPANQQKPISTTPVWSAANPIDDVEEKKDEICDGCIKRNLEDGKYMVYDPESGETPAIHYLGGSGSGGDVNFWISYAGLNNEEESTQGTTDGPTGGGGGGGSGGGDDEDVNCVTQTYGNIQVTVC